MLLILRAMRVRDYGYYEDEFGPLTVSRLRKRKPGARPKIFELPIAHDDAGKGKETVAEWEGIMVCFK